MSVGHIVVGGGTGFIGTYLCRLLRNKNYDCTVISRMPGRQQMTWIELKRNGLPENTSAVINLAGQNVLDRRHSWSDGFKQDVWNSRVNTTLSLARAITKAKKTPNVFIVANGVGYYEPHPTRAYSENYRNDNPNPDFLTRLCIEWEKAATLSAEVKCRQVILRTGVVLGRGGGMIKELYLPFLFGLGGPIMPGSQFLPWIHISDLCRLILYTIEHKEVTGVLNAVAPDAITNSQFSKAFGRALKRPAIIPVPQMIMNIMFSKERAKMVTTGQKVVPERTEMVGFKYNYPEIMSACKALVEEPL